MGSKESKVVSTSTIQALLIALVCLLSSAACAKLSQVQEMVGRQAQTRQVVQPGQPQQAEAQQAQVQPPPTAQGRGTTDVREACREEVRRLCGGLSPRSDAGRRCISDNQTKFSAPCRTMLQQRLGQ
jgi:hypothetical protein